MLPNTFNYSNAYKDANVSNEISGSPIFLREKLYKDFTTSWSELMRFRANTAIFVSAEMEITPVYKNLSLHQTLLLCELSWSVFGNR